MRCDYLFIVAKGDLSEECCINCNLKEEKNHVIKYLGKKIWNKNKHLPEVAKRLICLSPRKEGSGVNQSILNKVNNRMEWDWKARLDTYRSWKVFCFFFFFK